MKEQSLLQHVNDVRVEKRVSKNGKDYYVLVVDFDNHYKHDSLIRYGSQFAFEQLLAD